MKRVMVSAAVAIGVVLSGAAPVSASTTWRVQSVPKRPESPTILQSVSCPSKGNCTAVGLYHIDGVGYALAEHWDGTSWAIQPTPSPAGVSQAFFYGVSCPSLTSCTAVGGSSPTTGSQQLLAEHLNGSKWVLQHVPIPAGAPESVFYGVSCASSTSCTAVGQYYKPPTNALTPLAEHWDGTSWAVENVPLPAAAALGGQLFDLSCPTALDCVAVGNYSASNQEDHLLAERWNGTSWAIQAVPLPPGSAFLLNAVSCPSATACTAVGFAYSGTKQEALVERWTGTSWTIQPSAATGQSALFGVSCPSATVCTAAGQFFPSSGGVRPLAEHWDGTSWAVQPTTLPQGATVGAEFFGVSCVRSLYCTGVGDYGPGGHPLAEHEG